MWFRSNRRISFSLATKTDCPRHACVPGQTYPVALKHETARWESNLQNSALLHSVYFLGRTFDNHLHGVLIIIESSLGLYGKLTELIQNVSDIVAVGWMLGSVASDESGEIAYLCLADHESCQTKRIIRSEHIPFVSIVYCCSACTTGLFPVKGVKCDVGHLV